MRAIRIQLEYKCYPVWLYDDEGLVEDTALPPELSGDHELDERFRSIQERFDATYVDTPTEFYDKGFATPEEEAAFRSDLAAAVVQLAEKCPEGYSLELPWDLMHDCDKLLLAFSVCGAPDTMSYVPVAPCVPCATMATE